MAKTRVDPTTLTHEETWGNYQTWTSPLYSEVRAAHNGAVIKRFRGTSATETANRWAQDLHLSIHA